jgi:hypothetical protein
MMADFRREMIPEASAVRALPEEMLAAMLAEKNLYERALKGEIKRPDEWLGRQRQLVAAAGLAARVAAFVAGDPAPFLAWAAGARPKRWLHIASGKAYAEMERGRLRWPGLDDARIVIYRADDGEVFARSEAEFEDGRFLAIDAATAGNSPS